MLNEANKPEAELLTVAEKKETRQNLLMIISVVVLIAFGSIFFSFDKADIIVKEAGALGPIVLILLKASTIIFAPISGSPLYPLAGALFGAKLGVIYIFIGDFIGAAVSFWISRRFGQKVVARFLSSSNLKFLSSALEYMGTIKGLVIARILFSPLPEVVSYGAGLTRLRFIPFITIHSFIGLIPTILLVTFGASFRLAEGPLGIVLILILGSVAAVFGGWLFIKYVQPKLAKEKKE